jgi:copper(I)-binding protein
MVISNRIVRLLAAGALALSAPALAACSTDQPTDKVYNQAVGTNERHASSIDVLNAMIVSTEPGSGTFITTLVNNDNKGTVGENSVETLTGLTVDGALVKLPPGLKIEAGENLVLSNRGEGGIKVEHEDISAGGYVEVTLTFDGAKPVTLEVPVVTNTGYHAGEDGEPAPVEEPTEEEAHEDEAH